MKRVSLLVLMACATLTSNAVQESPVVQKAIRGVLDLELIPPKIVMNPDPDRYGFGKIDFAMNGGIALTRGGRLYCVWFGGEDGCNSYLIGTWSDDDGKTWTDTRFVVGSRDPIGKIGMCDLRLTVLVGNVWAAPDGTLRLYVYQAVNQFNGRGANWEFVCADPDAKEPVWSEARFVCWGSMHNKPIVRADGSWLLPTDFERNLFDGAFDHFPDLEPMRGCGVTVSMDGGKTWKWKGRARPTGDDHFCEHSVVELKDRTLLMYLRTGKGLMESRSTDGGVTWSEPRLPDGLRQVVARFGFIRLANGHLLVVKNGSSADKVNGDLREKLSAYISDDEGRTWKGCLMLDERANVSYPDIIQTPDGGIYVSYDRNRGQSDDAILLARFTEAEVLGGMLVEPVSFLKRIVFKERKP